MSKYTFDATFSDGSPRRYAGTWRPPFDEVDWQAHFARRHQLAYSLDEPRQAHQSGAFDKPLYHAEEEVA